MHTHTCIHSRSESDRPARAWFKNPDFIVNGFLHSGISKALDGISDDDLPQSDTNDNDNETSSDSSDESGDEDNAAIDYIVL